MKATLEKYIAQRCKLPHTVFFYDETDSTNRRAAEYIKEGKAKGGEVFIARKQSGGRGTRERSFYSEGGLYMSVIVKYNDEMKNVTPFASVCVCRAVDSLFGTRCKIKWVNDILLNERKLCGILCEAKFPPAGRVPDFLIIGIGVNTNVTEFPSELDSIATSLALEGHSSCDDMLLASLILCELEQYSDTLDEYRERSSVLGRQVTVSTIDGRKAYGRAVAIDDDGALVLEHNGKAERILHGDVFSI